MKTSFPLLATVFCLLLLWVVSCKKADDTSVTPGGTTTTKSSSKDISTVTFAALSPAVTATIDATAKTISATVASGTDVTKLVPTLTVSDKATVSPATGVAQDFSKTVTYTVTAEDGSSKAYILTVSIASGSSVCRVVSATMGYVNGQYGKVTYELDAKNRLGKTVTIGYSAAGIAYSTATMVETYDADGYWTQEKTTYDYASSSKNNYKDIITTNTYKDGRLAKNVFAITYIDASVAGITSTTQYEYDAQGNINKVIVSSNGGAESTTTIVNGVVTGITRSGYTYELNALGFVAKQTAADGSYAINKYNAAGQNTAYESYNAKGAKTAYTLYEYSATKYNLPTNPVAYKGLPTTIPSAYGSSGGYPQSKYAYYTVDASGKETLSFQNAYTWQVDSKGKLTSYTNAATGATSYTLTSTYQYQGCQ